MNLTNYKVHQGLKGDLEAVDSLIRATQAIRPILEGTTLANLTKTNCNLNATTTTICFLFGSLLWGTSLLILTIKL